MYHDIQLAVTQLSIQVNRYFTGVDNSVKTFLRKSFHFRVGCFFRKGLSVHESKQLVIKVGSLVKMAEYLQSGTVFHNWQIIN